MPSIASKPTTPGRHRQQRGQSLVEFALLLPIFLVLVFAIVDFGMGVRAWISITNAAREGARVGAIRGDCNAIKNQVVATSGGLVPAANRDAQITISPASCDASAGDQISVRVTYDYDLVTPLGGLFGLIGGAGLPSTITIESTSNMRVE